MKKTKLALLSMIVVTIVFCLTLIFHIQLPINPTKGNSSSAKDVMLADSAALEEADQKNDIQSFSLDQTADPNLDQQSVAEGTDTNQAEANTDQNNSPTKETDASGEASDVTQSEEKPVVTDTLAETADESSEKAKYADVGISIAKEYVNIRKTPATDGAVLGKLYRDSACEIQRTEGDWFYVESGTVTGYVKAEFIKTGLSDVELIKKYGTSAISVAVDGLNVREEKSTDSKRLTVVYENEVYPIKKTEGDWLLIHVEDDNVTGYVKSELVEQIISFKEAVSKEEEEKILQLQAEERAKKETVVIHHKGYSYTKADLKLLACLIHAEAGTQSYEGKLAVANVVLNRVKSSKYPDTIKAVIYQDGQFSVARSGSLEKQLNNYDNYRSNSQLMSIKAAKDALEGADNVGTRMYFHTYEAAAKKGYTNFSSSVKIGAHLFW